MENQDEHIPEHLKARWEQASGDLHVASLELCDASRKYNAAVLARIALSEELKKWQMKTYFNVDFEP